MVTDQMGVKRTKAEILRGVTDVEWSRKTDNNEVTYGTSDGWTHVRYHFTDILSKSANGDRLIINTGGWNTISTRGHIRNAKGRLPTRIAGHGFRTFGLHSHKIAGNLLFASHCAELQVQPFLFNTCIELWLDRENKTWEGESDFGQVENEFQKKYLGREKPNLAALWEHNRNVRLLENMAFGLAFLKATQSGYEVWRMKSDGSDIDRRYSKPLACVDSVREGAELALALRKF